MRILRKPFNYAADLGLLRLDICGWRYTHELECLITDDCWASIYVHMFLVAFEPFAEEVMLIFEMSVLKEKQNSWRSLQTL